MRNGLDPSSGFGLGDLVEEDGTLYRWLALAFPNVLIFLGSHGFFVMQPVRILLLVEERVFVVIDFADDARGVRVLHEPLIGRVTL